MRRFAVIVLSAMLVLSADVFSRRGRSGGFSSGGSRSSSFGSRSTSRSSGGSRTTTRKTSTAPRKSSSSLTRKTSTKKTAVKPKAVAKSKTDKALAKKNNMAAKKYGSRANAQKSFKEKMKSDPSFSKKYPNKFDKEPAKRPDYIPANVSRGGVSYNVTYMNGGYGYMGPLGTWIMLDMMTDIMVTDAMLRSHGYGTYGAGGAPAVIHTGPSAAVIVMSVVGSILGIIILMAIFGVFA